MPAHASGLFGQSETVANHFSDKVKDLYKPEVEQAFYSSKMCKQSNL